MSTRTIYLMLEIEATDDLPDEPGQAADELREAIDNLDAWPEWVYTVDSQDAVEPVNGSMFTYRKLLTGWPSR